MPDSTIAAPTLARTPDEAHLLLNSIEQLAKHGTVFLADGGSIDGFTSRLTKIPGVEVSPTPGTGPRLLSQVRQAFASARESGGNYILYTEPDKRWFFENRLSEFLTIPTKNPAKGIYLPARDAESFRTFPPGQQTPERLFNTLAAETLGTTSDFLYGPLLIHREILPYIDTMPADIGWGWRIFVLTVAARLGLPIIPWKANLPCPPDQQGEDDERSRTYRIEQMAQNVRGLALGRKQALPL